MLVKKSIVRQITFLVQTLKDGHKQKWNQEFSI